MTRVQRRVHFSVWILLSAAGFVCFLIGAFLP